MHAVSKHEIEPGTRDCKSRISESGSAFLYRVNETFARVKEGKGMNKTCVYDFCTLCLPKII